MDSLQGQLLIASPALLDPNFRRSVVLVTEHTEEGAAGLVLNRPSPAPVAQIVPELEPLVDDGEQVWVGGPVQPNAVLVLGEFLDPDDAAVPLFGLLGFPSLEEPDEVVPVTTRRRVFAGYAGWGAGQLEDELSREDWILEPALSDDAFTEAPDELWSVVLRRKGGVYEFVARRPGTFMYHPHADEMTQMAMGMMGSWVTHPKGKHPLIDAVDRDFVFLLNAYDVDPGSYTPKIMTMMDFNLWSWNSRIFPGIDPLVVRKNDKVRIRIGNLTMTNHPIHLHGHEFLVTGTDGGPTPRSSRWPEVTTDVAVGQMRQVDFLADEEGDWAFHCHKSHHTMNAMGHDVPTMIGIDHQGVVKQITNLLPDYMVMAERGMADMTEMEMPLPDNTEPMMGGHGPFGSVEMGGMFSIVKVRKDQKPGDYKDPGWYRHSQGTVAFEWTGPLADPARFQAEGGLSMPAKKLPMKNMEVQVRKPAGHGGRKH